MSSNQDFFDIREKLAAAKIKSIQLDPNGFCNNKCWFCPVAYVPNPQYHVHQMEISVVEKILKNCIDLKGNLFSSNFNHVWTAHYNEILLYKYLEDFLILLKKYNLKTTILSNGTTLSDDKIEILKRHESVISAICLNVPAATMEQYVAYTKNSEDTYKKVMNNIKNSMVAFSEKVANKSFNLMINGIDDDHPDQRQKFLGVSAPHIPLRDLHTQESEMRKMFPGLHIYKVGGLSDRASYLSKYDIFNHSSLWAKREDRVTGCNAGRMYDWLHVNSRAEAFLCCNDYNFEYTYGDISKSTIEEVWNSTEHVKTITRAFSGICRTCGAAMKEK